MKPQLMRNLADQSRPDIPGSAESVCGLKHGDQMWLKYTPYERLVSNREKRMCWDKRSNLDG